jgi:DNA-binding SARP family transcriptional activator
MRITVLGSLGLGEAGLDLTPTAPKQRALLGLMLLRPNKVASLDLLIRELWETAPPTDAVATVHTHMTQLRKVLHRHSLTCRLHTRWRGYLFQCEPEELDLTVALRHVKAGEKAWLAGRRHDAVAELTAALGMWPGPVLFDVEGGPVTAGIREDLEKRRLRAQHILLEARLAVGEHHELLAELHSLVRRYPLDERLSAQLMTALYRCGRQVEALRVYSDLRARLAEHHGSTPSPEVERLHSSILCAEVELVASTCAAGFSLDLLDAKPVPSR